MENVIKAGLQMSTKWAVAAAAGLTAAGGVAGWFAKSFTTNAELKKEIDALRVRVTEAEARR